MTHLPLNSLERVAIMKPAMMGASRADLRCHPSLLDDGQSQQPAPPAVDLLHMQSAPHWLVPAEGLVHGESRRQMSRSAWALRRLPEV